MVTATAPAHEAILTKLKLTLITPMAVPLRQRHDCLAALQWLRKCARESALPEPGRVDLALEACYHLCEAEAWEILFDLLTTPLSPALPYTFAEQLREWDFAEAQIDLYSRLLGKLGQRTDAICLRGIGDGYTRISQDARASESYQQSLAIFQAIGDEYEAALTLHQLGAHILYSYTVYNIDEAQHCLSEALQKFRCVQDARGIAQVAHKLGHLTARLGQHVAARAYFQESIDIHLHVLRGSEPLQQAWAQLEFGHFLAQQLELRTAQWHLRRSWQIFRQHNNRYGMRWSLQKLGNVLIERQKYTSAQVILQQALQLFREIQESRGQEGSGWVYHNLGRIALRTGNYHEARQHFQKILWIHVDTQENTAIVFALNGLANVAAHLHQMERSARLFGAVEAMCGRLSFVIPLTLQRDDEVGLALLRTLLDEATLSVTWQAGRDLPGAQIIAAELADAPEQI